MRVELGPAAAVRPEGAGKMGSWRPHASLPDAARPRYFPYIQSKTAPAPPGAKAVVSLVF